MYRKQAGKPHLNKCRLKLNLNHVLSTIFLEVGSNLNFCNDYEESTGNIPWIYRFNGEGVGHGLLAPLPLPVALNIQIYNSLSMYRCNKQKNLLSI